MTVEQEQVKDAETPEKPVVKRRGGIRLSVLVGILLVLIVVSMTYQRIFPSRATVEKELLAFMGEVTHGEGVQTIDSIIAANHYTLISKLKVEYDPGSTDDGHLVVGTSSPWWIGKTSEDYPRTNITFVDNTIQAITMSY